MPGTRLIRLRFLAMSTTGQISKTPSREDDYRLESEVAWVEPRSWASATEQGKPTPRSNEVFTHNPSHFGRRDVASSDENAELDVEPSLAPPPQWMLVLAGAAVAALMGALLGGFMHV